MDIRLELIRNEIAELLYSNIERLEIDINEIAQTAAVSALGEIRAVLENDEYSDFETVDEIVAIFNKYGLSSGGCHDFG